MSAGPRFPTPDIVRPNRSPILAIAPAPVSESSRRQTPPESPVIGRWLVLWMGLIVLIHGATWLTGHRGHALAGAIEQGAARVESRTLGEVPDAAIRNSIDLQQDSLSFWLAMTALGDFVFDPLALAARAVLVAVLLASAAALSGRTVGFEAGMTACAKGQWPWVLGLAVQVALMLAIGRDQIETSATLLLPPGEHPAVTWVLLKQLDVFVLLGWALLALAGWRRGQTNLLASSLICVILAICEMATRASWILLLGAGMRLTLLPE